ncbi:hypothetical protein CLOSCI_02821 [[Clostridium] scindens ATCC 35704]|nr:hypothetical protein CLOSCI_02821 [[Clostridium] scindens ATCC 35704]BDF15401.1 hypothetical protein CE91St59_06640 [[Clostridium] scindens]BDF19091.1 hypothetical protein CE91St60_06740 [[Clostridium] scindens]
MVVVRHIATPACWQGKENILKRDFAADAINQKWCMDITYIYVPKEGWTYLASVMDLYKCQKYRRDYPTFRFRQPIYQ